MHCCQHPRFFWRRVNTHTCGGFLSGFLELLLLLAGYIYLHAQTHTPIARAPNATHILYHIYYSIANLQNSTQTYHTFFFCFKQSAEFLGSNITIPAPVHTFLAHIPLLCYTTRARTFVVVAEVFPKSNNYSRPVYTIPLRRKYHYIRMVWYISPLAKR